MATRKAGMGHEPVPAFSCIEPGCEQPRWTVKRRGEQVKVSNRCYEHSNTTMFDAPPLELEKAKRAPSNRLRNDARDLLSEFHSEVRRQRLEREDDITVIRGSTSVKHPAKFSTELLPVIARPLTHWPSWRLPVHDPFAGTGERLGQLCDELGLTFSGTEIEPEFIVDPRVSPGDSTNVATYPTGEYVVVTSPTYPNGMSDHFRARDSDSSTRMTYRQSLAKVLGHDRPLHRNNSGRYTVRNGSRSHEASYWSIMGSAVAHWPARAVVNVKDFYVRDECYPLVDKWIALLKGYGYEILKRTDVATPGNKLSPNRKRAETEAVLVVMRPGS